MIALEKRWTDDQAQALRAMVEEQTRGAQSIAIVSGKGGVGKTSMAINLALELAQRGLQTTLLDVDLGLANVDVMLNLFCRKNLSHVVAGCCSLHEVVVEGPAGLRIVPGASGLETLANLSEFQLHQLLQQFEELESQSDILIMDLGAGISRNVLTLALAADIVLMVTTPEPTAVADAYATIKMLYQNQRMIEVEVLVNFADSMSEARQTYERLASVAARFLNLPVTFAGYVLRDEAVSSAVRSRRPFVIENPRCHASVCIRSLAQKYIRQMQKPTGQPGFFARLAQMFL